LQIPLKFRRLHGAGKKSGQVLVRTPSKEKLAFQPKKRAMSGGLNLENLRALTKYHGGFEVVGAVTLIASRLYMLNAYYISRVPVGLRFCLCPLF